MADDEKKETEDRETEITLVSHLDTKKPLYKMVGKSPKIQTKIDRLYFLVKQKETIKVSEAAKTLGVPEDTVKEWGEILEEHDMIKLHYPIAGKPSICVIKPKHIRKRGEKKPKEKPMGIPLKPKLSLKKIMINVEIIVFGLLFVYIFFMNRYLSINFIPTIQFHVNGFTSYIISIPSILISMQFSRLFYQPIYLGILVVIIALIALIIFSKVRSRKPKLYTKQKHEKKEPEKHEKKEEKKPEKKEKKDDVVFADIIDKYKKRLKEIDK